MPTGFGCSNIKTYIQKQDIFVQHRDEAGSFFMAFQHDWPMFTCWNVTMTQRLQSVVENVQLSSRSQSGVISEISINVDYDYIQQSAS